MLIESPALSLRPLRDRASQIALHGLDPAQRTDRRSRRAPASDVLRTEDLLEAHRRAGAVGWRWCCCRACSTCTRPGTRYAPDRAARARAGAHVRASISRMRSATCRSRLHDMGADFAVWCSYKYLNARPGRDRRLPSCTSVTLRRATCRASPAGGVTTRDAASRCARISLPIAGAEGWQLSAIRRSSRSRRCAPALELFDEAGMARLRDKSLALTALLRQLAATAARRAGHLVTPSGAAARGASCRCGCGRAAAAAGARSRRLTRAPA